MAALAVLEQANGFAYIDGSDGIAPRIASSNNKKSLRSLPDAKKLQTYADFAHQLADAARAEIQPYWRQSRHALGQEIKVEDDRSVFQSASPVTLADRAAERAMRDLIEENYPEHGIYGEEFGIKDEDADWVW